MHDICMCCFFYIYIYIWTRINIYIRTCMIHVQIDVYIQNSTCGERNLKKYWKHMQADRHRKMEYYQRETVRSLSMFCLCIRCTWVCICAACNFLYVCNRVCASARVSQHKHSHQYTHTPAHTHTHTHTHTHQSSQVPNTNVSCHTSMKESCHIYAWVASQRWMGRVIHTITSVSRLAQHAPTVANRMHAYVWVMLHIWISHFIL